MKETIVSSILLDEIVSHLLDKDIDNEVRIVSKLPQLSTYERALEDNYEPQDIDYTIKYIEEKKLTALELTILDGLIRWNFQNTGGLLRSVLGLVGVAVIRLSTGARFPEGIKATTASEMTNQFVSEPVPAIRRLIRQSVSSGVIEARIPMREMGDTFTYLTELTSATATSDDQLILREAMADVTTDVAVLPNSNNREYCIRLMVQIIKATREYKKMDSFGRLRSFLNNAGHFTVAARVMIPDDRIKRLSLEIGDIIHSTDRLLSANCVAAENAHARMIKGEVIYGEVMDIIRHQHRIMAVEINAVHSLFAYLLSVSSEYIKVCGDLSKIISNMIRYSGIGSRYLNDIHITRD